MRRCGYCDFNTYTATDMGAGASRGNYANMVVREMRLVRDWQLVHGIEEPPVSTVFFGGGTPTILPARDLVMMLDAVRGLWGIEPEAEITTEANPDTVDERYIGALAEGGFTRVSFGMQSAVPHVLKTLDRTHTPAECGGRCQGGRQGRPALQRGSDSRRRGRALTIGGTRCALQSILA